MYTDKKKIFVHWAFHLQLADVSLETIRPIPFGLFSPLLNERNNHRPKEIFNKVKVKSFVFSTVITKMYLPVTNQNTFGR